MKRFLTLICALLLWCCHFSFAAIVWDGMSVAIWTKGSGTETDPYLIETPANLAYLRQVLCESSNSLTEYIATAYYKQTEDFDFNGNLWSPIGFPDVKAFSGNYDGGGRYISNVVLSIVTDSKNTNSCYGIFGECKKATFKNMVTEGVFTLKVPSISAGQNVVNLSPLVAIAKECIFTNCTNNASCNFNPRENMGTYNNDVNPQGSFRLGGISGYAENCTLTNCKNTGDWNCFIYGSQNYHSDPLFGGIVGCAQNTIIKRSYNSGNLCAQMESYKGGAAENCGGIVGTMTGCTIQECYNSGKIVSSTKTTSTSPAYSYLGGIVGKTSWDISYTPSLIELCYNTGDIVANVSTTSYSYGKCLKGKIGGMVGSSGWFLKINACYNRNNITISGQYDSSKNSQSYMAGIIGEIVGNDTISNSYTATSLVRSNPDVNTYGTLSASVGYNCILTNAHYISTTAADQIQGTAQDAEYMKSEAFVDQLNENGAYFRMDTKNENEGFPILGCFSTYQLQVKAEEGGTVYGSGNYAENAQITISAIPSDTYKFVGWSDGVIENPRTITLQSDSTITASFHRTHYAIKVSQDCSVTME